MKSEVEKADVRLLYQLKDHKRRFIILAPCENPTALTSQSEKTILTLHHYDALITARVHSNNLKGKYTFIFDLENENHLYKLEQLLTTDTLYDICVERDVIEWVGKPAESLQ